MRRFSGCRRKERDTAAAPFADGWTERVDVCVYVCVGGCVSWVCVEAAWAAIGDAGE